MSKSKRVFITGGASGLGLALAERYAKAGWRVAICDVHEARGDEALKALLPTCKDVKFLRCDVTRDGDVDQAAAWLTEHWGGVDLVFNNAGVASSGRIEEISLADWQWIVDINLLGVVRGCRTFVPMMKRQGTGHIVNVSSLAGLVNAPKMSPYNAVKAAVVSLSETLYSELSRDGVAVSVACPSFFRTNLMETARGSEETVEKAKKFVGNSPLGAAEIAEKIYRGVERREFLILPDATARRVWHMKRLLPISLFASLIRKSLRV